jgi:NAD(P)-dependent dehydrogenase (short-subunit alcohol dehydrogenase family)
MKTFENKTVLITGGTSGIGKPSAFAFAKEGANVATQHLAWAAAVAIPDLRAITSSTAARCRVLSPPSPAARFDFGSTCAQAEPVRQ